MKSSFESLSHINYLPSSQFLIFVIQLGLLGARKEAPCPDAATQGNSNGQQTQPQASAAPSVRI
jgi:hypothetical protein